MNKDILEEFMNNATLHKVAKNRYIKEGIDGIVFCDICAKESLGTAYGWSDYDLCVSCYNKEKNKQSSTTCKMPLTNMKDVKFKKSCDTSGIYGGSICGSICGGSICASPNMDDNATRMKDSKFDDTHRVPRPKHRDVQSNDVDTWYRPSNPYQAGMDMFDKVAGNTRINNEKGKMCMEDNSQTFMCDEKFDEVEEYGDYANTRRQKFTPDDEY